MPYRPPGQWDDLLAEGYGRFGALSYLHAVEVRRQIDVSSGATHPAGLRLSDRKLRQLCPTLYFSAGPAGFARCLFGDGLGRRAFIRGMLRSGDARAAVVVAESPLLVACYSDDLDGVCVLRFRKQEVRPAVFRTGDRLLTVLNAISRDGPGEPVAADLMQGDRADPACINFWPLVAELVSDNAYEIACLKEEIPREEYDRCRELGERHLRRFSGAFRDGRPDQSLYPAL